MVDAESRERLGRVNGRGGKFKVDVVPIDRLELLEKNARYMTNEQFTNLVGNLRKDGELSSVPFCLKVGDRYRVLSGNHRVKAAQEAGIAEVLILYREEPMSRGEEVATILSHNAISGQDDLQTLRELYEEIQDVDLRYYSGLDDTTLEKMEKLSLPPLSEIPLEYRQVAFVFLPEEADRLAAVTGEALDRVRGDEAYLARFGDYDRFLDTLEAVKQATNVKNVATVIMLMLEVVEKHMDELPGYIVPDEAQKK
jgi:hypothetical protein